MNSRSYINRKWVNLLQTILIIAAMSGILALLGWLVAGKTGVVWAFFTGIAVLIISSGLSSWSVVLRMYNASPLRPEQLPVLYRDLSVISRKAGLHNTPVLFYIPSQAVNAFSMGNRKSPVIAVTNGLLRTLNLRELRAVLAHEISHIRNNDIKIMNIADVVSQMTALLALGGQLLLIINLPLILMEGYHISWWIIALLILAPGISTVMQMALSRTREFDADMDAAMLTKDPIGLAQALSKLEYSAPGWLTGILLPRKKADLPSILRTHPKTEQRIDRLISLSQDLEYEDNLEDGPDRLFLPASIPGVKPRGRKGIFNIRFF